MTMTAEQWNASYPAGTPVVAYPSVRPEDERTTGFPCTCLTTRTRSVAWTLGGHTPVVLVDGYTGGIALSHVDVHDQARRDDEAAAVVCVS